MGAVFSDDAPGSLLIFPCNGSGIEALDCLDGTYRCIGFVDDAPDKRDTSRFDVPVLGREALSRFPQALVLAVPGSPSSFRTRRQAIEGLGVGDERFATVVHPAASVSPRARIGRNVLIMAGAVITSNAVIGDHVCVLSNTVVHHDAVVGAWSLIGSNVTVAGGVRIGQGCYVGSGSSLKNGIALGEGCLLGLGSNAVKDIPAGSVCAGNPARPLDTKRGAP